MFDDLAYDLPELIDGHADPAIPEENYWFVRQLVPYRFAAELVGGRRVLDAGCGDGYGTAVLVDAAREVIGVDTDDAVLRRAGARVPRARFEPVDLGSLPFADASFDAVVSVQAVERVQTPHTFVTECARVLRPDGILVVSTPNRLTFSRSGVRRPLHAIEFGPDDLGGILAKRFTDVRVFGVSHGPRIVVLERLIRAPFPERQIAQLPERWPSWLRRAVAAVRPTDFRLSERVVERSLDLVAVARP